MKRRALPLLLLAAILMLTVSCGANKKPVGAVGDAEILYEELRFEVLTYLDNHPNAEEAELRAAVEQSLKETYALLELCREKLNATTDREGMDDLVDAELEKAIAAFGDKSTFEDYLKEVYLTESLMRRRLAITQLQIELETEHFRGSRLESTATLIAWLDQGNYARVRRVFLPAAMGKDAANAARIKLSDGTNPADLFTAEQQKMGAKVGATEYFYRDLHGGEEEAAALALTKEGQCSSLIESTDGYTFFLRVEDDRQTMVDYQAATVLEKYREAELAPVIEAKAATLTLSWNEYGSSLILKDIQ